MANRKFGPQLHLIESITFPAFESSFLRNNIPVHLIDMQQEDVVKIEFIINAGRYCESKKAVSAAVNGMLKDGTSHHSSFEIAELLDFYGATINAESGPDIVSLTLFSLNKYLENVLPVVREILTESIFPEKEFKVYQQKNIQRILVDLEKAEFLATKEFNKTLFGINHPLGYTRDIEDIKSLKPGDLKTLYGSFYTAGNFTIICSGKIRKDMKDLLNEYFGTIAKNKAAINNELPAILPSSEKKHHVQKKDAVQSAIRIGRILFNKPHPEFVNMRLLTTMLGGYFGSRLMSNIREDKGYTYGIYSSIGSFLQTGYLIISAEVGTDVTAATLHEIYYEIERIQNEKASSEELELVKNYMLGNILSSLDGAFNVSSVLKGLLIYNLKTDYFYNMVNTVKSTNAETLQKLASKYFKKEDLFEIVAGVIK
jgi:zinc protease